MYRADDRRLLNAEGKAAFKDAWVMIGGLMTTLGFADLVGYEFRLPPIKILLYQWDAISTWFWSHVLFFWTFELNAAPLTSLAIMSGMFLRGRFARYVSLARVTRPTQVRLFKSAFWVFLASCLLIKLLPRALSEEIYFRSAATSLLWGAVVLLLVASLYMLLAVYIFVLERTAFVLRVVRHPWLLTILFVYPLSLDYMNSIHNEELRQAAMMSDRHARALVLQQAWARAAVHALQMFLPVAVFPLAFWYIRVFVAVIFTIGSLFAVDVLWGLFGPTR